MLQREASRKNWSLLSDRPRIDEINSGSLQRIADATELMAKNHQQLVADCEYWERQCELARQSRDRAFRRNAALKGVITKFKKRMANEMSN